MPAVKSTAGTAPSHGRRSGSDELPRGMGGDETTTHGSVPAGAAFASMSKPGLAFGGGAGEDGARARPEGKKSRRPASGRDSGKGDSVGILADDDLFAVRTLSK